MFKMQGLASGLFQQQLIQLLPWVLSFSVRSKWNDPSISQDVMVYLLLSLMKMPSLAQLIIHSAVTLLLWLTVERMHSEVTLEQAYPEAAEHILSTPHGTNMWAKPLILPCRTTHSRRFPQKHSFAYSYLFVGIPVGWSGCAGSMLSADRSKRAGWFHVDPADYLSRGDGHQGFRGKLDAYLVSQQISPSDYPFAYLVTAPRFCGYSFNPVSFWYLYSEQKQLTAMILEVNNTFDERRVYILDKSGPSGGLEGEKREDADSGKPQQKLQTDMFKSVWKKDFHVSPFNSREGSYNLAARDINPFDIATMSSKVSNTITLSSSGGHRKLIASVFSDGNAVDPTTMTSLEKVSLVLRWGWVGFVTFPRILREAWKLYFKKSLTVFFKPEVAPGTIARHATEIEKVLEVFFLAYLEHVVDSSNDAFAITYRPAPGTGTQNEIVLTSRSANTDTKPCCELTVLSPSFYSRFVHYAHTSEALDREYLCTDVRNRTIAISNINSLVKLFLDNRKQQAQQARKTPAPHKTQLTRLRWLFMQRLRCPPANQSYGDLGDASSGSRKREDIRSLPLSELDVFVSQHSLNGFEYRRRVTLLFLAQRFGLGFTGVIQMVEVLVKILVLGALLSVTSSASTRIFDATTAPNAGFGVGDLFYSASIPSGALHIYTALKGFT